MITYVGGERDVYNARKDDAIKLYARITVIIIIFVRKICY